MTVTTTTEVASTDTSTTASTVTTDGVTTTTATKKTLRPTVSKTSSTTVSVAVEDIQLYGPADGTVIDPMSAMVRAYMDIKSDKEAAEFWVASYTENDVGATFTATWKYNPRSLYRVVWADNPEMKNAKSMTVAGEGSLQVVGLPHNSTCYWQVTDFYGKEKSEVRTVKVLDAQVRWMDADGGRNMRDLGGWKTESGKTVKYGMLYRGACIDGYNGIELTALGKQQFREVYGIKTQLDLRRGNSDGDNGNQSTSDFGGAYVKAGLNQYDYIFTDSYSREALGKIFSVLADESNYPIYFHCNAGADRTGTLSFLINGLLGVSYEDLTRDFELTGMAIGKRLRSKLDVDTLTWSADGVMQNNSNNYIAWGPLYNKIMTNYRAGDGKLSSAIAKFLMTECGVTQEQIDNVRRLMLK